MTPPHPSRAAGSRAANSVNPNRAYHRGAICSFIPVVAVFPAALVYLWLFPPVEIEVKFGYNLAHINYLLILAGAISALAFFILLKRRYSAFLFSVTALFVLVPVFIFQVVLPVLGPYRSTKGPAQKLDAILQPGEDMLFYSRVRDSALFYTDRKAVVVYYPELKNLMASEKPVYCLITLKDWDREVKDRVPSVRIIFKDGNRMIISNLKNDG